MEKKDVYVRVQGITLSLVIGEVRVMAEQK